jgi:hypothetical protein
MLLPVLAKAKYKAKHAQCLSNLHQIEVALNVYSGDFNFKLPALSSSSAYWPWDVPVAAAQIMLDAGMTKPAFFDPSTSPPYDDNYNWANTGTSENAPDSSLWWNGSTTIHRVGYAMALNGGTLINTNQNVSILPEVPPGGAQYGLPTISASDRELVACCILSVNNTMPANSANNYVAIPGSFPIPHTSAHLEGNPVPSGSNIGFKDGHAEWRKFNVMVPRTTTAGGYFWW